MGILDKVMFWKKDDDFDFDKIANDAARQTPGNLNPLDSDIPTDPLGTGDSLGKPSFPETQIPPQTSQQPTRQPTDIGGQAPPPPSAMEQHREMMQQPTQASYNISPRDIELLSSKLDTIKAILVSLDQRTSNLEKVAGVEKTPEKRLW